MDKYSEGWFFMGTPKSSYSFEPVTDWFLAYKTGNVFFTHNTKTNKTECDPEWEEYTDYILKLYEEGFFNGEFQPFEVFKQYDRNKKLDSIL